jgi:hypothetical protein
MYVLHGSCSLNYIRDSKVALHLCLEGKEINSIHTTIGIIAGHCSLNEHFLILVSVATPLLGH